MTKPTLEKIKCDVGSILYFRWRQEGKHSFDDCKPLDLREKEYINMYVRQQYRTWREDHKEHIREVNEQLEFEFGEGGATYIPPSDYFPTENF